jgi:flavin-dependent dehydrogenase
MLYDIAIIGGGLGGLALSILLAKSGKKVILFEKETYPFHKVCGEYISMESWEFVKSLGIELIDKTEFVIANSTTNSIANLTGKTPVPIINRLHISACNGNLLTQNLDLGGFGISRYSLDNQLAKIARSHGVVLLENTKVDSIEFGENIFTISANHVQYRAQITCGAYGKRANIDVKLQRNFVMKVPPPTQNFVGVKYHVVADLPHNLIELHNFKDGYCGISKVDDLVENENRFCLCYLTTAKNLHDNHNKIAEMEQNVLMKNPFLKKYFSEYEKLYDKPLVISQINFQSKQIIENHILMLGDAAGLITPLCGNGMSMALHSAKILNALIMKYLDKELNRDELETVYVKTWRKHFAVRVYAGRMLQKILGNEQLTNIAVSGLKKMPAVVRKLVSLTHGKSF